ncbi:AraC family ligand binding domain-containing protein [Paenibacillus sp. CC-CFT742]|nr:AraC family ligand binding domain-containing protein [Paenibacillus sp. CC-CFT742]WJH32097.1 AraC family ligand binding domain-containing protein [Paenibacillus sp. CC-CFT742]
MFVLEGEGTFIQNGQQYPLRARDAFCLFPHVTHEYWTDPKEPLQKIFIAFDGTHATELLSRVGLTRDAPHRSGILTPETASGMRAFMEEVRRPQGEQVTWDASPGFSVCLIAFPVPLPPRDCSRMRLSPGCKKGRNTWISILPEESR